MTDSTGCPVVLPAADMAQVAERAKNAKPVVPKKKEEASEEKKDAKPEEKKGAPAPEKKDAGASKVS